MKSSLGQGAFPSIQVVRAIEEIGRKDWMENEEERYIRTSSKGTTTTVDSMQNPKRAHTQNFVDAIVNGENWQLRYVAGLVVTFPTEMALHSCWQQKAISYQEMRQ